jgi:hypothetical protein
VEYQRIWWLLVLAVFEYGSMFSFLPFVGVGVWVVERVWLVVVVIFWHTVGS